MTTFLIIGMTTSRKQEKESERKRVCTWIKWISCHGNRLPLQLSCADHFVSPSGTRWPWQLWEGLSKAFIYFWTNVLKNVPGQSSLFFHFNQRPWCVWACIFKITLLAKSILAGLSEKWVWPCHLPPNGFERAGSQHYWSAIDFLTVIPCILAISLSG